MKEKGLLITLGASVSIFLVLLVLVTQVLGLPLWYVFNLNKLQLADTPSLLIQVIPETPSNIGERVTVTVTNSSSGLPVENVTVHITKDSMKFDKYTDSNGKVTFDYLGEVTVVYAEKTEIKQSDFSAIPKSPDIWVRNLQTSIISAVCGSLLTGFISFMIQKRIKNPTTNRYPKVKRAKGKKNSC